MKLWPQALEQTPCMYLDKVLPLVVRYLHQSTLNCLLIICISFRLVLIGDDVSKLHYGRCLHNFFCLIFEREKEIPPLSDASHKLWLSIDSTFFTSDYSCWKYREKYKKRALKTHMGGPPPDSSRGIFWDFQPKMQETSLNTTMKKLETKDLFFLNGENEALFSRLIAF